MPPSRRTITCNRPRVSDYAHASVCVARLDWVAKKAPFTVLLEASVVAIWCGSMRSFVCEHPLYRCGKRCTPKTVKIAGATMPALLEDLNE